MPLLTDPNKNRSRYMVDMFDVRANIARSMVETSLSAQQIIDGVRLTHEEFLYLYEHARPSMYADTK